MPTALRHDCSRVPRTRRGSVCSPPQPGPARPAPRPSGRCRRGRRRRSRRERASSSPSRCRVVRTAASGVSLVPSPDGSSPRSRRPTSAGGRARLQGAGCRHGDCCLRPHAWRDGEGLRVAAIRDPRPLNGRARAHTCAGRPQPVRPRRRGHAPFARLREALRGRGGGRDELADRPPHALRAERSSRPMSPGRRSGSSSRRPSAGAAPCVGPVAS